MKRLFFALDIANDDKTLLSQWQLSHVPDGARIVDKNNFHITLAFLGMVPADVEQQLIQMSQNYVDQQLAQKPSGFQCHIGHSGGFSRAKVVYLGFSDFPKPLTLLAKYLSECAVTLGLKQEHREYNPHITLFRKAKSTAPHSAINMTIKVSSFSLYHSQSTPKGVVYTPIKTWSLVQR